MTTLLIVDDHAGFRRIARMLLEQAGFEVIGETATSAAATSAVRALHPDVMLLDVQLPDISGFETAKALQAEERPPRIVLISSRTAADYAGAIEGSPALGFITKSELTGPRLTALLRVGSRHRT